jgi:homoserine kinase
VATDDRLHQPYRFPLIPGAEAVMRALRELGALGVYVSGAGPSIIAIVDAVDLTFERRVTAHFTEHFPHWQPRMLLCDETGATATTIDN